MAKRTLKFLSLKSLPHWRWYTDPPVFAIVWETSPMMKNLYHVRVIWVLIGLRLCIQSSLWGRNKFFKGFAEISRLNPQAIHESKSLASLGGRELSASGRVCEVLVTWVWFMTFFVHQFSLRWNPFSFNISSPFCIKAWTWNIMKLRIRAVFIWMDFCLPWSPTLVVSIHFLFKRKLLRCFHFRYCICPFVIYPYVLPVLVNLLVCSKALY